MTYQLKSFPHNLMRSKLLVDLTNDDSLFFHLCNNTNVFSPAKDIGKILSRRTNDNFSFPIDRPFLLSMLPMFRQVALNSCGEDKNDLLIGKNSKVKI